MFKTPIERVRDGFVRMNVARGDQHYLLTNLKVTDEQLQGLIDNKEAVIGFDISPVEIIWITNADTTEVSPFN